MSKKESEFGRGLCYCLALFLCHSERDYNISNEKERNVSNSLWFNGFNAAGDHLVELEIPKKLPKKIKERLTNLKNKVLKWRDTNTSNTQDKDWAVSEAKELIMLIDKFNGIKTCQASWD